ncbi:hypothetical protein [Aquimarina sp. 2201CG5-10]|uniref:hypothetical protein n=1 Tax=Aquimarina callyspongiae TaxID=3098150 RepID=UPI002AB4F22C|nr:hypothetical protein [Aquimarina sp. 2201CG5-10]MDY8134362.1 hypothetical protein [Aquimarina sp. 2201CG5-10]
MKYTRLSLLYSITVLFVSGLLLLSWPNLVFSTLWSNTSFPPQLSNLLGVIFLGLGSMVGLIFYYKVEKIYRWTIFIRIFFSLCTIGFYYKYQNPFFIAFLFIILIGVLITVLGLVKDQEIKNIT